MPNWCINYLELRHDDPRMIARVRRGFRQGRMLASLVPVPESLLAITAGSLGDPNEQTLLEQREQKNLDQHGYANWYDFCVNEWGTKWDVGERGGDDPLDRHSVAFSFDSAWAPPTAWYEKAQEQGFWVRAHYWEPGMAFAGIWCDGDDDYYELSGLSADQVAELLPRELDDSFGISDSMRDWEEPEEADDEAPDPGK